MSQPNTTEKDTKISEDEMKQDTKVSKNEMKQYLAQIELAKTLNEAGVGQRGAEFLETIQSLLIPPSYQNMNAQQMRDFQIQKHVSKIKRLALGSDSFSLDYEITWNPVDPVLNKEDTVATQIMQKLAEDGYQCTYGFSGDHECIKVRW